jgi:hypothetical protein
MGKTVSRGGWNQQRAGNLKQDESARHNERPRSDSNRRITDLQSVPLVHLGTRPRFCNDIAGTVTDQASACGVVPGCAKHPISRAMSHVGMVKSIVPTSVWMCRFGVVRLLLMYCAPRVPGRPLSPPSAQFPDSNRAVNGGASASAPRRLRGIFFNPPRALTLLPSRRRGRRRIEIQGDRWILQTRALRSRGRCRSGKRARCLSSDARRACGP